MCLILVAINQHERYPLIIGANRDEYYGRPTNPAGFWAEAPDVIAGRDLKSGGTWLGITRAGRWAAVTNYREPPLADPAAYRSRGDLVRTYLTNSVQTQEYVAQVAGRAQEFAGFSLLLGDPDGVTYVSNRDADVVSLQHGLFGLSNGCFDEAWPKVAAGKRRLGELLHQAHIDPDDLLALLADRTLAAPEELPDTGIGRERERLLSSAFVVSPDYGTRSSTAIIVSSKGRITFLERAFHAPDSRRPPVDHHFEFALDCNPVRQP